MSTEHAAVEAAVEEAVECPYLELVPEPGRMAALRADLLPYLPTRRNLAGPLAGVGAGTLVLLSRGWTWIWAEGWQDAGMRAGGVLLAGYAGCSAVMAMSGPYTPFLPTAVVLGWVIAAKHQAPKDRQSLKKTTATATAVEHQDHDEDQDDEPEYLDQAEPLDTNGVAVIVRRVAARHPKHLGVHLADLLGEAEFEGWEQSELKTALTEVWGLPVLSFKLGFEDKARTREGVRLEHLPPALAERAGEGPARGLALVPSQHPAEAGSSTPASTPSGVVAGVVVSPSPSPAPAPSRGLG